MDIGLLNKYLSSLRDANRAVRHVADAHRKYVQVCLPSIGHGKQKTARPNGIMHKLSWLSEYENSGCVGIRANALGIITAPRYGALAGLLNLLFVSSSPFRRLLFDGNEADTYDGII